MPEIFVAEYIFGIDGGKTTGVALWRPKLRQFDFIDSGDFWDVFYRITEYNILETAIFIEDPGINKPTFGREKMKRSVLDRKAQNVGGVKRETKLLGDGLMRLGYQGKYMKPIKGGKWDAATLEQMTGWTKPTNEHARDAARLVFNRGSRIILR